MQRHLKNIRQQILWVNLLPVVLLVTLLSYSHLNSRMEAVDHEFLHHGQNIAEQFASASVQSLFEHNYHSLELLAETALQQHPDASEIAVADQHGLVIVEKKKQSTTADTANNVSFHASIQTDNRSKGNLHYLQDHTVVSPESGMLILGKVSIRLSENSIHLEKRKIILHTLFLALIVLVFSSVLALILSSRIALPIEALTNATKRLREGNLDARVEPRNDGEIGELQRSFNEMAEEIASASENMLSQVDQATQELKESMETLEIQNVELDLARKRALQASQVKSEFLASMSHEIRTPMNGILGFTQLLGKTSLESLQQEYLQTIETSASSLLAIINDILDFSKLEANKLVLENAPFSLRSCIDHTVALLAPLAHQKQLELVSQIYNDVPDHLQGDQTRISQIITNLLNNAIKFTEQGDVVLKIVLEEDEGTQVTLGISVTDTGIGIPADKHDSIFSAFSQATSPDKTLGGTGLGLSISKRLVNAMHGTMSLRSKPGEGSCFSIQLTLKIAASDSIAAQRSRFSGRSVVLIEPHPQSRLVLQNQLQMMGIHVQVRDSYQAIDVTPEETGAELLIIGISGSKQADETLITQLNHQLAQLQKPALLLIGSSKHKICRHLESSQPMLCISKPTRQAVLEEGLAKLLHLQQPVDKHPMRRTALPDRWLAGYSILVVDDNSINLDLMKIILRNYGADVHAAAGGEEAIQLAKTNLLDLIIMDIHMPQMNGFEVASRIRQQVIHQHTPVVALTADAMQQNRNEVVRHGFNGYLIKPIDEAKLRATLARLLLDSQIEADSGISNPSSPVAATLVHRDLPLRDTEQAMRIAGNSEAVANKLFRQLLDSLPQSLQLIATLHQRDEWQELWQEAHKLQGGVSVCATPALMQAVLELETAIKQENRDGTSEAIAQLEYEIHRLSDSAA